MTRISRSAWRSSPIRTPRSGAQLLTREEAVNLAAHLVAVADPVADHADGDGDYRFEDVLDAVVKERGE